MVPTPAPFRGPSLMLTWIIFALLAALLGAALTAILLALMTPEE